MEDVILWRELLDGNKNALEKLYRNYVQDLYDYGKRFSPDENIVEDCIQNLFIDLWEKRDRLGQTEHVRGYLMLAIRRRILKELKNQDKQVPGSGGQLPEIGFELDFETRRLNLETESELLNRLNGALDKLSPKQKEILYLKYGQGLNHNEIATLLDINYQSARNALHRALIRLKELMILFFL